jgi:proline dehydrogenase
MNVKLPFFLASRFVAGESLDASLPVIEELRRDHLFVALDKLGEHVHDRAVAEDARDSYIELVRTLGSRFPEGSPSVRISIKLSMMGQLIDHDFCLANVRQLMDVAAEHNLFVRLDMEGSDLTDSTLAIFEAVYPEYPDHVGVVLQAMLKRTADDIERMCALNASVRLCKGAYKEPSSLAYQDMDVIRARFVAYMKQLIRDGHYPGIATHDDQIIQATKRYAAEHDVSREDFEFQMLYGIRPETQREMIDEGYNMLVYVPFGTEWLPYFSRRLRERKENVWFIAKNLFRS